VTGAAGSCELSVVIPARNAADTIGVQLESLVRQRFDRPWEVVVVDNGSTDGTRAAVESFADRLPGLRIVDASERQGIGYARNRGVEAACGRLIAYCDADDAVSEGSLWRCSHPPRPRPPERGLGA
jgi:glycosyltransferase involved in cell wall biosynthesis